MTWGFKMSMVGEIMCGICVISIVYHILWAPKTSIGWMSDTNPIWFLRVCVPAKMLQSCPSLCDRMDCSLPGSSVLGILQARILEWIATPSSRGSSWSLLLLHLLHWQAGSLPVEPTAKPLRALCLTLTRQGFIPTFCKNVLKFYVLHLGLWSILS